MEMRAHSAGVYVSKESYILNIKKSRNTAAEQLNRSQNNTAGLKKKINALIWRKKISSFQLPKQ